MTKPPKCIEKQKILCVEGKDEEKFFKVLLQKHGLHDIIQVIESGGREQFSKVFPEIVKMPDFDQVQSLAVIQDADQDGESRFKSICYTLTKENLGIPKQISDFTKNKPGVGIFLLPDGKNKGNLESLCLSTVRSESIIYCIDSFMACVKQKFNLKNDCYKPPKNPDKAKCKAFLSAMEEDTPSLGIATEKGYWNLDSDQLKPLLNFLQELNSRS